MIADPYCTDGILVTPKGTTDHDYEADRPVTYATNGVHAYCFEKAGATYVFTKGRWVRIVDSD